MKALIYNSGLGKRMGDLTANCHKSMVKLQNGETIFERQIRLLQECGIRDVVVTTGPFKEQLESVTKQSRFSNIHFTLIENSIYDQTNYIYSMYLAKDYLDDDMILLHGDLVFNKRLLNKVLLSQEPSTITINRQKALPEKDFKGRVKDGKLQEVSINIFDEDCFALQPMYKLDKETLAKWVGKTVEFVESGNTKVYAENAFNEILPTLSVKEFSYENDYIDEIDNPDDLQRVSSDIRAFDFREQPIYEGLDSLKKIINEVNPHKIMVVSDKAMFDKWPLKSVLEAMSQDYILFSEFGSNPQFNDIVKGIRLLNSEKCDFIISIGGGSSIDTAKVIKLYSVLDYEKGVTKDYQYNPIKHLAIPTTAGTGSESTRFAVCYYEGKKQSVTHDSIVPDYVILEPQLLMGLPLYQKKATIFDALCQAVESYWSVNSNEESKSYSKESIRLILEELNGYINDNNLEITSKMLHASNLAGKAINITQTTAAHAMSYKLTSMYGIAHGHAVATTLPHIWRYMINNTDKCIDPRGEEYLIKTFNELNESFGCSTTEESCNKFEQIFNDFGLSKPEVNEEDLDLLASSVNPDRLKNNPVELSMDVIKDIYVRSLSKEDQTYQTKK